MIEISLYLPGLRRITNGDEWKIRIIDKEIIYIYISRMIRDFVSRIMDTRNVESVERGKKDLKSNAYLRFKKKEKKKKKLYLIVKRKPQVLHTRANLYLAYI